MEETVAVEILSPALKSCKCLNRCECINWTSASVYIASDDTNIGLETRQKCKVHKVNTLESYKVN